MKKGNKRKKPKIPLTNKKILLLKLFPPSRHGAVSNDEEKKNTIKARKNEMETDSFITAIFKIA